MQGLNLIEVRRVTIVTETTLEKRVLEKIQALGAKGYTCNYCFGKGRHEVFEDPYTGRSLVQIVVLARPSVAEAILRYLDQNQFEPFPHTAYMDTVVVLAGRDHHEF